MGLTSAPATEAIMGVVPKAKAGVGSAVNDATRLLGGTLGVAVIGSVYASLYASRLTGALPTGTPGVGGAGRARDPSARRSTVAGKLADAGHPALAAAVHDAATSAFFHGFHAANLLAGGVAAAGAVMALALLLPAQPTDERGGRAGRCAPAAARRPRDSRRSMTDPNPQAMRTTATVMSNDQPPSAWTRHSSATAPSPRAGGHEGAVVFPKLRLFVITCLDPRVDPAHFLGLGLSDAMVVRNVGGRVTPEVINDVAFIGQLAETVLPDGPLFEVAVIHHTQCGTGALADDTSAAATRSGSAPTSRRCASTPYSIPPPPSPATSSACAPRRPISPRVTVSGHVYDVVTGLVETVIRRD